jgi:hypothetical protein
MSYLEDYEFVFRELADYDPIAEMRKASLAKRPNPRMFVSLPHPKGSGRMPCSFPAYQRIREMAEQGLARSDFAGRVEPEEVFKQLKEITVQKFLRDRIDLNQRSADRAVSAAVRAAGRQCVEITHFIPVHLGHEKTPAEFSLGPVRFQQRPALMERMQPALSTYVEGDGYETQATRDHLEFLANDAQCYYNSFDWIAEVRITGCDPTTSRQRAKYIVQRAVDCLHLLVSADYSNHMRAGGPRFETDRRGRIEMDIAGKIEISISADWQTHHLGKDWWDNVNSEGGDELVGLIGIALQAGQIVPVPPSMTQRFLDGAAWYGEAARDEFLASKLVKYVTAIERILVTEHDDRDKITERLSERGAAMNHEPGRDDLALLQKRFKDIYDLRSRLVHGSRSPLDESFGSGLLEAEALARSTLIRSLSLFRQEGLENREANDRQLEAAFERVREWANFTGPSKHPDAPTTETP